MASKHCHADVYPRDLLLALRAASVKNARSDAVIKLTEVPAELWLKYTAKVGQRSKSRARSASRKDTSAPEVTEVLAMHGNALQEWMRKEVEWKRQKIQALGAQISESKGVKGRCYLVVSGPCLAVEKALPILEDLLDNGKAATAVPTPMCAEEAAKTILAMVKSNSSAATPHVDQEPLSKDDLLLQAMEAREDAEVGADVFNADTFGETHGWSHEENVVANQALSVARETPQPPAVASDAGVSSVAVAENPKSIKDKTVASPVTSTPKSPTPVKRSALSKESSAVSRETLATHRRPPPPPVPAWSRPPASTFQHQGETDVLSYHQTPPCTSSPRASQNMLQLWACPACTLLNPQDSHKCSACEGPRPSTEPLPKPLPVTAPTAKKAPAKKVAKIGKTEELVHPLPQRNAPVRRPPRVMTSGGLLLADLGNSASGPRWAERPVEKIWPCSREAEEEDPELACYIWKNRSQVERHQRASPKWGFVN